MCLNYISCSVILHLITGNFDILNYYFINYKALIIICNLYLYLYQINSMIINNSVNLIKPFNKNCYQYKFRSHLT